MQTTILVIAVLIIVFYRVIKKMALLTPAQLIKMLDEGAVLVDVRTSDEYSEEHVAGARNYPLQSLSGSVAALPRENDCVLYCASGNRSAQAISILRSAGFTRVFNAGGITRVQRICEKRGRNNGKQM